jgi:hypothetical protein
MYSTYICTKVNRNEQKQDGGSMLRGKTLSAIGLAVAILMMSGSVEAGNWFNWTLGGNGVKGSGDMVTEDRDVREFSWIETLGAFDVFVKVGEKQSVLITFDDNLIDLIETKVKGKTLKIFSDESFRSKHTCKIEITVPKLEGVTTRGSGDIMVENVNSDRFRCHVKGSGDITVKGVKSEVFECDINGSGDITVKNLYGDYLECHINGSGDFSTDGEVEELEIRVYGSGDVDARDLRAKQANVVIKGSGDARVHADDSFDGSVYGSGDITYYGDPEHTSKHISGSGSIRRR